MPKIIQSRIGPITCEAHCVFPKEWADNHVIDFLVKHDSFKFDADDNIVYLPISVRNARALGISPYTDKPLDSYFAGLREFLKALEESWIFENAKNGDKDAIDKVIAIVNGMRAEMKQALQDGKLFIAPIAPDGDPEKTFASGGSEADLHDSKFLAAVILGDVQPPSHDALFTAVQARLPDARLVPVPSPPAATNTSVIAAQGMICMFVAQNFPLPITEAECSSRWTWLWPRAWEEVQNQRTHVVVSVSGENARAVSIVFGQVVAATIEASNSPLAVHCASSYGLWPANAVVKLNTKIPPIPLCVSISVGKECGGFWRSEDKLSVLTKGLDAFGLNEIEAGGYRGQPMALYSAIFDIVSYLIDNGPVLKDGDTVGPDEATKVKVRREKSKLRDGNPEVYRLYF